MKKAIINIVCISLITSISIYGQSSFCETDANCPTEKRCVDNECILQECMWNSDCDGDTECIDGFCVLESHELERP